MLFGGKVCDNSPDFAIDACEYFLDDVNFGYEIGRWLRLLLFSFQVWL